MLLYFSEFVITGFKVKVVNYIIITDLSTNYIKNSILKRKFNVLSIKVPRVILIETNYVPNFSIFITFQRS